MGFYIYFETNLLPVNLNKELQVSVRKTAFIISFKGNHFFTSTFWEQVLRAR